VTVTISGLGRRFQLAGVALVLVALAIALFARPAAAAPTATATPATGLENTGTLAVAAGGFATDGSLHVVFVLECELGATDSAQCDANTADSSKKSNTAGTYTNNAYTYFTLPNEAIFGGPSAITCDSTNDCGLVVIQDDYNNFNNPHVEIPITFSAVAATTVPPSTTTAPPTSATTATTATTGATSTAVTGTTVPDDATTAVAGTTSAGGTTTTAKGTATSVAGQGSGNTLPVDPSGGGGGSVDSSGGSGSLPFTGPPTAAPIVALCGLVILFAGTLMRRVVLRVPNSGVSLS
jgi:hypothetical protein